MSEEAILAAGEEWVKAIRGGQWWKPLNEEPCRGYGDAITDTWEVQGWKGEGPTLARFEPFVMFAHAQFARTAGSAIGANGVTPHFIVTPFETDARNTKEQRPAPSFEVDGGLWAVPFAAKVQFVWPGIDAATQGKITFTLTTYAPPRVGGPTSGGPGYDKRPPLAPLGIGHWYVTRWVQTAQRVTVPDFAQRFRVSDANYGVKVSLWNATEVVPAPFAEPHSLGGSPDIQLDFLAPLTGAGSVQPTRMGVQFYV